MTVKDLVEISFSNLWRAKLRTGLTVAGVVIAIATLVAMLSFAAGNQRYFTTAFEEFGLLNQMTVRPGTGTADSTARVLNGDALKELASIPGVKLVYPFSSFQVEATVLDTTVHAEARSLSTDVVKTTLFAKVLGGKQFSSDTAKEVIVTHEFVELLNSDPGALLGQQLTISRSMARMDSAIAEVFDNPLAEAGALFRSLDPDSVRSPSYQRRVMREQLSGRMVRFMNGLMNKRAVVSDTLTIIGVAPEDQEYDFRTSPIVVTDATARRLGTGGIPMDNPTELLELMQSGSLFDEHEAYSSQVFPRATMELQPLTDHNAVADSVEALGFRANSLAQSFAEMQRFMVYFYLGLGVVGLIAIATASLGIINTLVMSVTERRKEIGILKSLGADERHIRALFLAESAVIGIAGATAGILLGWIATRIVAAVGKEIMARENMPIFDPFALPLWLVCLAMGFGILVSLAAGLYPAARAARVDPVEALRST